MTTPMESKRKISRTEWGQEHDTCWLCGRSDVRLETHEITRGNYRPKAVKEPATWCRVCRGCHSTLSSMTIAEQLALKLIHDPEFYDLDRFLAIYRPNCKPEYKEEMAVAVDAEAEVLR
jgi:hypothetical protein